MIRFRQRQRGIALLLVLTVVAAASILGMSYLSVASVQLSCSSNLIRANEATYLAESGVQHGLWLLRTEPETLTAASAASPLGPYQLDSDGGEYTIYAVPTGNPLEYEVIASATSSGVTRTSKVIARIYSKYQDTILSMGPVHLWRLGEIAGSTALDVTGSQNGEYMNHPALGKPGRSPATRTRPFTSTATTTMSIWTRWTCTEVR